MIFVEKSTSSLTVPTTLVAAQFAWVVPPSLVPQKIVTSAPSPMVSTPLSVASGALTLVKPSPVVTSGSSLLRMPTTLSGAPLVALTTEAMLTSKPSSSSCARSSTATIVIFEDRLPAGITTLVAVPV